MSSSPTKQNRGFWHRIQWVLRIAIVLNVAVVVWAIGFRGDSGPPEVLPDTSVAEDVAFSLDLEVIATVDHDLIYAVEQRARPAYRIFSLDPATGATSTIFTVPDDAIIYGIALSPDRATLAVAYTPDFALEGNGLWMLDLASGEFEEQRAVTRGVHLVDPSWSNDGTRLLATEVDRRGEEELAAVAIDIATDEIVRRVDDAINPVEVAGGLHFLSVDEDKARRSIGVAAGDGTTSVIDVGDAQMDLDHLTASRASDDVHVAVLDLPDTAVTFGDTADAHGSHDVPSSWFAVPVDGEGEAHATDFEPIIVYDAAATESAIVYATKEGLSIATDERVDVIASRAIRFVAA